MPISKGDNIWYKNDASGTPQLAKVEVVEEGAASLVKKDYGYVYTAAVRYVVEDRGTEYSSEHRLNPDEIIGTAETDYLTRLVDNGERYAFYGADGTVFKLNDTVLQAIEDENDGYRSYLETVATYPDGFIFFRDKLADVLVIRIGDENMGDMEAFDGYALVDAKDEHVWLLIGTEHTDDYYPSFVFQYFPKKQELING